MNGLQQQVRWAAFAHLYPGMAGAGLGGDEGQVVWTRGPGLVLLCERSRTPPLALLSPAGLPTAPRHALSISELGGGRVSSTFHVESEVEELRAVEDPGQRGLS